jgi:tRNA pseudouridine-54 N-methylase
MRWAGLAARIRKDVNVYQVLAGKPGGRRLKDQGEDGRIILERFTTNRVGRIHLA